MNLCQTYSTTKDIAFHTRHMLPFQQRRLRKATAKCYTYRQMTAYRSTSRRVVLVIPTNGVDGRARLRGILRYFNDHPTWDVVLITTRTEAINGRLAKEIATGCDGLIISAEPDIYDIISSSLKAKIPTVIANEALLELSDRTPHCRAVILDDEEIGAKAAHHLKAQGTFASYAFYTVDDRLWSRRRYIGFARGLHPLPVKTLFANEASEADWLNALPKPTAIFASNDLAAKRITSFAQSVHIQLPYECNIIGCDNDILVCQATNPRLTSIKPNFEEIGYVAAQSLDKLMRGNAVQKTTVVKGCEIVIRESTHGLSPATQLINRAVEFIRANACRGIGVVDVASHLHVSRSLLDLRYREIRKSSVFEDILSIRLAAICHELRNSNIPIGRVTRLCGFKNPASLKRLFRNRYGMSMREYREQEQDRKTVGTGPSGGAEP